METLESKIISPEVGAAKMIAGIWPNKLVINKNNFIHKSLSDWSVNVSVGCSHGCGFCYVPSTSVNKQGQKLAEFGVDDSDGGWGYYVLLRKWDESVFLNSLVKAQFETQLSPDGNHAVMYCTTTDPYQVISGVPDQKQLNQFLSFLVRRSLELIRDCSTLNVRILTRGPLAKRDFELFKSFGNRLVFGMSLPTLNDKLARVYEPDAPSVTKRLETLKAAKEYGLHVYVAIAPTYPECDGADLRRTLMAIKELDPITIFHEPINIRAENVQRIAAHAKELGVALKTEVFETPNTWRQYAMESLMHVHHLAEEIKITDRLKLWPDPDLIAKGPFLAIRKEEFPRLNPGVTLTSEEKQIMAALDSKDYDQFAAWVNRWWDKISEWPGKPAQAGWKPPPVLTSSPFAPVSLKRIQQHQKELLAEKQSAEKTGGSVI